MEVKSEKKIRMYLIDNEVHNHVLTSDEDSWHFFRSRANFLK